MTQQTLAYEKVITMGALACADDEYFTIQHPDGQDFPQLDSKDFGRVVAHFCAALDLDWDAARDQGFALLKVRRGSVKAGEGNSGK